MAVGDTTGFVKLVFDEKYGELLGAHIVGSEATELIAELGVAKALETTREEIAMTIHAHPTLSESIMEAAMDALDRPSINDIMIETLESKILIKDLGLRSYQERSGASKRKCSNNVLMSK